MLVEHYADKPSAWAGWASLLPGRSSDSRSSRANKLGVLGPRGPRRDAKEYRLPRPRTCGDCRFYHPDPLDRRKGKCLERSAARMFGSAPKVLARYSAETCVAGEVRPT